MQHGLTARLGAALKPAESYHKIRKADDTFGYGRRCYLSASKWEPTDSCVDVLSSFIRKIIIFTFNCLIWTVDYMT